jgi:hypothetical protein
VRCLQGSTKTTTVCEGIKTSSSSFDPTMIYAQEGRVSRGRTREKKDKRRETARYLQDRRWNETVE